MKAKLVYALIAIMGLSTNVNGQSKDDLKSEIEELKQQNQTLMQMVQNQQVQGAVPPSQFGQAIQKTKVEVLALTTTGKDIRGYGRGQSAKSNFARNKAENQARMELARQIEGYARYAVNQYNEETIAAGHSCLDAHDQESAITAAKNVIEGAKIIDSQEYYDANNKMYTWEVCVAYDRAALYTVMEEQSFRIKRNKTYFERKCQEYFDDMDRMKGRLTETAEK